MRSLLPHVINFCVSKRAKYNRFEMFMLAFNFYVAYMGPIVIGVGGNSVYTVTSQIILHSVLKVQERTRKRPIVWSRCWIPHTHTHKHKHTHTHTHTQTPTHKQTHTSAGAENLLDPHVCG